MSSIRIATIALAVPLLLAPATLRGQDVAALATRLSAMTAVSGFEQGMADTLRTLLPGSTADRAGDIVRTYGAGTGGLLLVCPMDEVGYVVGEIRPDGWLTLRRVGAGVDQRYDRWLQGERITVWGARGPMPGVVAVRSVHLTRGRGAGEAPFTADDALVDIGASSAAEAATSGVRVLDPVAREKGPISYGDGRLAAPWAGRRTACAALVAAGRAAQPTGRVVIAFVVEQQLGRRGLLTVANTAGPFDRTWIVDGKAGPFGSVVPADDSLLTARVPGLGKVTRADLPVKYQGTPVETVSLGDARTLADLLVTTIGGVK